MKNKKSIQVTLDIETIKWLVDNHIKKSTLIQSLLNDYIKDIKIHTIQK